jgi:hypothetical protein
LDGAVMTGTKEATKSASFEQLIHLGMEAYATGDYLHSVDLLEKGKQFEQEYWMCRLYLAMAYFRVGKIEKSRYEFRQFLQWCPVSDLRSKARLALEALHPQFYYVPEYQMLEDPNGEAPPGRDDKLPPVQTILEIAAEAEEEDEPCLFRPAVR